MRIASTPLVALIGLVVSPSLTSLAWDYEGHRVVNQLAIASLPTNFPGFIFTAEAQERVAFLSGEPDRWRNTTDNHLHHVNRPDHFIDLEDLELYRLKAGELDSLRYEFIGRLASIRATNAPTFPGYDAVRDQDRTKLLVGLLPWTIAEYYSKVKSGFSYLKVFEQDGGTAQEISNAQQNLLYVMGTMGHFVGDASQPLHTTQHYNGWVGENTNGYTTNRTFHSWIDGGYLGRVGLDLEALKKKLRPARSLYPEGQRGPRKPVFEIGLVYIQEQFALVEPLYKLDKEGRLSAKGDKGLEGKEFFERQLIVAGQMLGDFWLTAWQTAPMDGFLKGQLSRRKKDGESKPAAQ